MLKNIYIPTTIIDGFLDYPEKLRDFALGQDYMPSEEGLWPGIRSKSLYDLSPLVYNAYIQKILNIFFLPSQPYNYVAESYFQIISKKYDSGWVHKDSPCLITAMLYLTPDATSGTSLYEKKDIFYNDIEYQKEKVKGNIDVVNNSVAREKHNKNYDKTLDVKGMFNRLFIFDSSTYHSAHDFFGSDNEESRLTLVTFFNDISGSFSTPLQRIKSNTKYTVI